MKDIEILSPGERLRKIRKELGLTQDDLAGEKFSKNYISMFENNRREINIISATFLVERINKLAQERGKKVNITTAHFLKTEEDIADQKCKNWLDEVESNLNLSNYEVDVILSKVIQLSTQFKLEQYLGKALFLKGLNLIQRKLYNCSIVQFLQSIVYFSKINDISAVVEAYKNIGIALFKQNNMEQAISILTLAESFVSNLEGDHEELKSSIKQYKSLCYFQLNQLKKEKSTMSYINNMNREISELENRLKKIF